MADHVSAQKRARQAVKRAARNIARMSRVRGAIRKFRRLAAAGDAASLHAALQLATRELQKAGSKGVLHRRNVSRRISRLTQAHNKIVNAPAAS